MLTKKTEFYSELIDKLIALIQSPLTVEDVLKDFYGKLYIQGSPKLISSFLEIVESIKANGSDRQILENNIRPQVDAMIAELCREISQTKKEISLLYSPSHFKN